MSDSKKSIDLKLSASLSRFGIKGRGGGGTSGASRLPSLKPARDLTLGGVPKRTFTPNIVGRSTKKEEFAYESELPNQSGQRHRGRGRDRGRGRSRGRGNIVSSSGIFSQGPIAQQTLARALGGGGGFGGRDRFGGSGNGTSRNNSDDFTSIQSDIKASKGVQEDDYQSNKVLQMLADSGKIEIDEKATGNLVPTTLPLTSKSMYDIKKEDCQIKDEVDDINNKNEEQTSVVKKVKKSVIYKNEVKDPQVTLPDLFQTDSAEGQIYFMQFPDTLPIKPISDDSTKVDQSKTPVDDVSEHLRKFTFQNVSEGYIGKLQIHRSGKGKMHLGNVSLDISLGTPCGFLQELISVHVDNEPGEMLCLGHVNQRIIAVPDYEALLGSMVT